MRHVEFRVGLTTPIDNAIIAPRLLDAVRTDQESPLWAGSPACRFANDGCI
jgi:hypothetical protein